MSFSFCLNRNELLTLCGLSLLYQGIDLKQEGKLMQDGQRLVNVVVKYLENGRSPCASDFKRLTATMLNQEAPNKTQSSPATSTSTRATPSPPTARKQLQPQLYRHNSMSESDLLSQQEKLRRATLSNLATQSQQDSYHYGHGSLETMASRPTVPRREYRNSTSHTSTIVKSQAIKSVNPPNLDYLSLNNTPPPSQLQSQSPTQTRHHQSMHNIAYSASPHPNNKTSTATASEWEVLVGSFDDRHLYDAIYGGGPPQAVNLNDAVNTNLGEWNTDSWEYTSLGVDNFTNAAPPPTSVLSFSDESLSSGDELSASDLALSAQDNKPALLAGSMCNENYDYLLEGLDRTQAIFGL